MKDLLVTQKRIRKLLEEWLTYCRNALGILEPDMYIMPDLPMKSKDPRFNAEHDDYDKIAFYRLKSRSAENLTHQYDLFDMPKEKKTKLEKRHKTNAENDSDKKRPRILRSKSAFISKLYYFNYFALFSQ